LLVPLSATPSWRRFTPQNRLKSIRFVGIGITNPSAASVNGHNVELILLAVVEKINSFVIVGASKRVRVVVLV
jgi:hypothetical protein